MKNKLIIILKKALQIQKSVVILWHQTRETRQRNGHLGLNL